jgi:iron complex outermembrane receptor protein
MRSQYQAPHAVCRARPGTAFMLLLLAFVAQAAFASAPRLDFDLPEGVASDVFIEFSAKIGTETDLSVLYHFDALMPYRTRPVRGTYSPLEALEIMTKDTGLVFVASGKTLIIGPPHYVQEQLKQRHPVVARATAPRVLRRESDEIRGDVTVTGSTFRRDPPTGAQRISIDHEEILSSGFLTAAEVVRTLPQVFGGGPTEDTFEIGREAPTNIANGVGLNLRGLGAGSTLPLVNGRRMAPGGRDGMFSDVLSIPLIAVDRIDVLADGASAVYGSDAVGGVVNFVLRDEFEGAETRMDLGGVTNGPMRQYRFGQLFGNQWDRGGVLFAFERYHRDNLPASARALVRSDLRRWGGDNFDSPNAYPPNLIAGTDVYAVRPRSDGGFDLVVGEINLQNTREFTDALPEQDHISLYATATHRIHDRVSLQLESLYTERSAFEHGSAPGTSFLLTPVNPYYVDPGQTGLPVVVNYNFINALGPPTVKAEVTAGNFALRSELELGREWMLSARASHAFERPRQTIVGLVNFGKLERVLNDPDPSTAFNPFGPNNPATIDRIRTTTSVSADSRLRSEDVLLYGPLKRLAGGPIRFAAGIQHRAQRLDSALLQGGSGTILQVDQFRDLARDVVAGFAEAVVPLIGPENSRRGFDRLELSAMARYEHYRSFGGAVTPRLGIAWSPVPGVSLRATWSESYRAPNLTDIYEGPTGSFSAIAAAPDASGTMTPVLVRFGNNPRLHEESATSWTVGLDFTPASIPGLSVGATFFDIEFRERISEPVFPTDALINPNESGLVTLNPSAQMREQLCSTTLFISGTVEACLQTPVAALIDLSVRNMAFVHTRGIDLAAEFPFDTRIGSFKLGALGTYILDFEEQASPTSFRLDRVDTQNYPIDFRLRSSLRWSYGRLETALFLNYADGYRDTASEPGRRVRAMTTADLNLAYTTGATAGAWLENTRLSLHVENIWDESPPFLNNPIGIGYDQENADILGRVIRVGVQKSW